MIQKSLCICKNTNIFLTVNLRLQVMKSSKSAPRACGQAFSHFIFSVTTYMNSAQGIFVMKLVTTSSETTGTVFVEWSFHCFPQVKIDN